MQEKPRIPHEPFARIHRAAQRDDQRIHVGQKHRDQHDAGGGQVLGQHHAPQARRAGKNQLIGALLPVLADQAHGQQRRKQHHQQRQL